MGTVRQWKVWFGLAFSSFQSDRSVHLLTVVDELHVFLVCGGESLFLAVVCGQSRSRLMVLLTIRAVENYLGCREADG